MKHLRLGLALLLAACQTDSTSTTDETEQAFTLASSCDAVMPALQIWDGKPPPKLTNRYVLLRSQKYAGWWLLTQVDTAGAKVPWGVWVHDTQLKQMAPYIIEASIAGPGGTPPPPPCELDARCHVALARGFQVLPLSAYDEAQSCSGN